MARNLLSKYIWILETVERYGRITRSRLNELWEKAVDVSGGEPLARRTFYNYRNSIEDIFGISICYSPETFEYYIESGSGTEDLGSWLISSMTIGGILRDAGDIADRIMLEDVPSSREFLSTVISAIKSSRKMRFSYTPFYRTSTTEGIVIEPYFLRIFKQRWYVIGHNPKDRMVKTYSLDRFNKAELTQESFEMPEIGVKDFFRNFFGIMTSKSEARRVVLQADSEQAKYLRALPLHPSQQETVCDGYSNFSYQLCITYDLVQEILSFGRRITVIHPVELRTIIINELKSSLEKYETT